MSKSVNMYIRFDAHLKLIIQEIAERQNTTQSEVVKMLCYKAIKEIKDEKGNTRFEV